MPPGRPRSPARKRGIPDSARVRARLTWLAAGILLFILLQVFVFQDEGLYRLIQLKQEVREMESRIELLEEQNAELASERERILNDPEYLERIARERFRMAKPGEKVFHVIIEEKAAADP